MTESEIKIFKNELRSLKAYRAEIDLTMLRISDIDYMLSGSATAPMGEVVRTTNPEPRKEWYHTMIERKDQLIKKLERCRSCINEINVILQKLSYQTSFALVEIYCNGKTYQDVSRKLNISISGLFDKIHGELKKL